MADRHKAELKGIRFSKNLIEKGTKLAEEEDRTFTSLVRRALRQYIEKAEVSKLNQ